MSSRERARRAKERGTACPPRPLDRVLAASRQRARGGRHHSTSRSRCRTTPKSSRGSVAARRPSPRAAAAPRVCVRAPLLALCAGAAFPVAGPPIRASAPRRSASTCTSAASSRRRVEPPPIYPTRLTLAQLCKPARPTPSPPPPLSCGPLPLARAGTCVCLRAAHVSVPPAQNSVLLTRAPSARLDEQLSAASAQLVRAWARAPYRAAPRGPLCHPRTVPSQLSLARMRCSAPHTSAAARFGGL